MEIKTYGTDEPPQTTIKNEVSAPERDRDFLEHLGILRLGRNFFLIRSGKFRKSFTICNYAGKCVLYQ